MAADPAGGACTRPPTDHVIRVGKEVAGADLTRESEEVRAWADLAETRS